MTWEKVVFRREDGGLNLWPEKWFFLTMSLLRRATFWPPSIVYTSVINTQTLQITYRTSVGSFSCTASTPVFLTCGYSFHGCYIGFIFGRDHNFTFSLCSKLSSPNILSRSFNQFSRIDIVGSYLPCCIFGLLVIFGLMVQSSGQKYSVVQFLFIWMSDFGLMDTPQP